MTTIKTLLCGCGETLCSDHAPRPQKEMTMTKDEQFRQQDNALTRAMDSHAERLKKSIEAGYCPKCKTPHRTELNERNITFRCSHKTSCRWFAIYPIRAIGNSERAMRDENLDLVAIAEREVIEKARAWADLRGKSAPIGSRIQASEELAAAISLLNSREQARDQIEADAAKFERLLAIMP